MMSRLSIGGNASARVLGFGERIKSATVDDRLLFAGLVLAAFGLQFWAIWSVNFPPLHDVPNHMARHFLEKQYIFGLSETQFYEVGYKILPNLGGDVVIPFLMAVFSPVVALKIFLSAATFVYWLGPALFIREHANNYAGAMAASLLLLPLNMSEALFWGFLNYYVGFGLAFLVLVHFESLIKRPSLSWLELALHSVFVALLFFCHLTALGIYAVVVACRVVAIEWDAVVEGRRNIATSLAHGSALLAPLIPSVLLYVIWSASKTASPNYWGTWGEKLSLPLHLFRTYSFTADGVVCVLWILAALAFFGLKWRGHFKSWLWMPALAFAALTLAVPIQWGSTYHGDARIPPAMLVCFLAIAAGMEVRRFAVGAALVAAALLVRYGSVYVAWTNLDTELTAISKALAEMPRGSRVMPVVGPNAGYTVRRDWPATHFVSWVVPLRDGFDPGLYAFNDQQPLTVHRDTQIYAHSDGHEIVVDDEPTRALYDYVYVYNPIGLPIRISSQFDKVFEYKDVTIWRVSTKAGTKGF
jgi:hypothetical protein